jgi:hypothetical protein
VLRIPNLKGINFHNLLPSCFKKINRVEKHKLYKKKSQVVKIGTNLHFERSGSAALLLNVNSTLQSSEEKNKLSNRNFR